MAVTIDAYRNKHILIVAQFKRWACHWSVGNSLIRRNIIALAIQHIGITRRREVRHTFCSTLADCHIDWAGLEQRLTKEDNVVHSDGGSGVLQRANVVSHFEHRIARSRECQRGFWRNVMDDLKHRAAFIRPCLA